MTAEYDLVILDIMLPDVNGWDIIRMLRTAGKGYAGLTADSPRHDRT
ncbi:transcriptional regulatory protein CusR [Enterobacter cloacae]|uniref:Transcriptional regulatory protein CusR n=1 Tax=Enterobacter cloacae TaxID=550 RepID=A0A377LQT9_ENTCL|nr:transcriptional regulatory protein CusR [Enterobacter cloacae]